jgi:uncharacterized OB-fold protein
MLSFDAVRTIEIETDFRHSAGRLGSHFLKTIRDEARLLGWRTGDPRRVIVPPKDLGGAGEWVALGPGAVLEAYAPWEWQGADVAAGSCLALVRLDGADMAMLASLKPAYAVGAVAVGTRLLARFAPERRGSITDFWFEVAS